MFILKLLSLGLLGLLIFGCSGTESSFAGHDFLANPNISPTPPDIEAQGEAQDEEELLRYLVEKSDLIVVGKVTESRFLVDPAKMKAEIENALREKRLLKDEVYEVAIGRGEGYIGGKIFDVAISETLYMRSQISSPKIVRVYSIGNPFSLHTRVVPLIPEQKYLLFLSRAKDVDIVNELKIQNPNASLGFENVLADSVFLVTEGATGAARPLKNNDRLIKVVKLIAKELTP